MNLVVSCSRIHKITAMAQEEEYAECTLSHIGETWCSGVEKYSTFGATKAEEEYCDEKCQLLCSRR